MPNHDVGKEELLRRIDIATQGKLTRGNKECVILLMQERERSKDARIAEILERIRETLEDGIETKEEKEEWVDGMKNAIDEALKTISELEDNI